MYILKVSGKKVKFDSNKVYRTCRRAGADKNLARKVASAVEKRIYEGMNTREILKLILSLLGQHDLAVADRYNLKEAILQLGPGGFVFEKFIVRLLQSYGYQAWCPEIIRGACVDHEVDIIARLAVDKRKTAGNNSRPLSPKELLFSPSADKTVSYMIECKYHEEAGMRCGLKETLYTWARFIDIKESSYCRREERVDYPWLVSNVKLSQSAIKYAECRKMRMLGWHYPSKEGLEILIEKKKVYPITILRGLSADLREKLFSQNVIVCQDLIITNENILRKKTDIEARKLSNLINEARLVV